MGTSALSSYGQGLSIKKGRVETKKWGPTCGLENIWVVGSTWSPFRWVSFIQNSGSAVVGSHQLLSARGCAELEAPPMVCMASAPQDHAVEAQAGSLSLPKQVCLWLLWSQLMCCPGIVTISAPEDVT